jgi:hypothetical protein
MDHPCERCFGLEPSDLSGRVQQKFDIFLDGIGLTQGGLVPNLPFIDQVRVAADHGADPVHPGTQRILAPRDLSAETHASALGVQAVPVAEAHPGLDSLIVHVKDDLIQPGKIVYPSVRLCIGLSASRSGTLMSRTVVVNGICVMFNGSSIRLRRRPMR